MHLKFFIFALFSLSFAQVQDPSFEAGYSGSGSTNPYWAETSFQGFLLLCDQTCFTSSPVTPPSGVWFAWLGGTSDFEECRLFQTITIPNNTQSISFYLRIRGYTSATQTNYMEFMVDNVVLRNYNYSTSSPFFSYSLTTIDVSAFADGGSHVIEFHSVSPNYTAEGYIVNWFIDVVTLNTQGQLTTTTATATATATATTTGNPDRNGISPGLIGGAVGGSLGFLVIVAIFVVVLVVVMKKKKQPKPEDRYQEPLGGTTYRALPGSGVASSPAPPPSDSRKAYEIDYNELKDLMEIGKGSFGIVYRGTWRSTPVAVKQLNDLALNDEKALADFRTEAEILKNLRNHPNVVLFIGITSPPQPVTIVTEFCAKGSLWKLLKSSFILDENTVLRIVNGIAKGMLHLHSENVVHRDLAARNILVTENLEPKVSDFGLSRKQEGGDGGTTQSAVGPLKWMAPESIQSRQYSPASDVWSFGVVIWEIFNKTEPFPTMDGVVVAMEVCTKNLRLQIPNPCHPILAEIMRRSWVAEPERRITFKEICNLLYDTLSANSDLTVSFTPDGSRPDYNTTFGSQNSGPGTLGTNGTRASAVSKDTIYGAMEKV